MSELYIDGTWRDAASGETRDIIDPHDGSIIATVSEGGAEDAKAAIAAARRAFDDGEWRATPATERGKLVTDIARIIERDIQHFAELAVKDTGKPLADALEDMGDIASSFRHFGQLADKDGGRVIAPPAADVSSRVVREPVGVCAQIAPWNYPLLQASWKIAPALVAGNTIVVKPSEITPMTTIEVFRRIHDELELPPGVANLVLGAGATVGEELVTSHDVDLVSFTGGLETGKHIMSAASTNVKKIALELGGKNPNVVFADADLEVAAEYACMAAYVHAGQVCSAGTRLIVEESAHDELVDRMLELIPRIKLGNGFTEGVVSGPLVSAEHREKVEGYIELGQQEGAKLRAGGKRPDDPELANGFYVEPTLFDGCTGDMRIVQEETFGPIITVETFPDGDEQAAIATANDTVYGLAGAVWSNDAGRAERVANALRHGTVWINDYHPYIPQAEWGGMKQSGIGRELGLAGLDEYTELKHIYHNTRPVKPGFIPGGDA